MVVRLDLNISLDGFATTTDQTPQGPGEDWMRLVAAYAATKTVRERVFGDTSGSGTTGTDEKYARKYFEGVGAEIMGAGMFGLHSYPDDADWRGWWGEEPPFHCPVFVLTHRTRPSIEMAGGTTFHFLDVSVQDALHMASSVADGKDIRIGGGAHTARAFLKAGLIDYLHVAIAPILLGRGIRLWDELRGLEAGYEVSTETAESGTVHVIFRR